MICLFLLTQSTNVTDRQTDTAWRHRPRLCIASCGKKFPAKVRDDWHQLSNVLLPSLIHCVSKTQAPWCLIITLANVDRFSQFFRKKINYVHITKISTSPAICCYTTKARLPSTSWTAATPHLTLSVVSYFVTCHIENFLTNHLVKEFWKLI